MWCWWKGRLEIHRLRHDEVDDFQKSSTLQKSHGWWTSIIHFWGGWLGSFPHHPTWLEHVTAQKWWLPMFLFFLLRAPWVLDDGGMMIFCTFGWWRDDTFLADEPFSLVWWWDDDDNSGCHCHALPKKAKVKNGMMLGWQGWTSPSGRKILGNQGFFLLFHHPRPSFTLPPKSSTQLGWWPPNHPSSTHQGQPCIPRSCCARPSDQHCPEQCNHMVRSVAIHRKNGSPNQNMQPHPLQLQTQSMSFNAMWIRFVMIWTHLTPFKTIGGV